MLVILNAAMTALNVALYAIYGHWYNLAAAVFIGLVTLYLAVVSA